jgi:Mn2+/Fe2+ NRAMP family transporter
MKKLLLGAAIALLLLAGVYRPLGAILIILAVGAVSFHAVRMRDERRRGIR